MMEEWHKKYFSFFRYWDKYNKEDGCEYHISREVIGFTEQVLSDYGSYNPPCEGLVYWGGEVANKLHIINMAIAPNTLFSTHRIDTSHTDNYDVVKLYSKNKRIHLGQVHSHPGNFIDHSYGDNKMIPFKSEGLISIVAPYYGTRGVQPLITCGIHKYLDHGFIRLSNKYIKSHFEIVDMPSVIEDLRSNYEPRRMV